uniref:Transmembrane protein 45B n=1 Tax=Eutreptiella gymnastica TaxID=73025 RepID=A0A6U7TPU7_9EUGL
MSVVVDTPPNIQWDGQFGGHVAAGLIQVIWGTWWIMGPAWREHQSERKGKPFRCTTAYNLEWPRWCRGKPIEGVVLTILGVVGVIICSFLAKRNIDGSGDLLVTIDDLSHVSMFFFYGVSAVTTIIYQYHPHPPRIDLIILAFCCYMQVLLLYHHVEGRNPLDGRMHELHLLVVLATGIAATCEAIWYQGGLSWMFSFARGWTLVLQGIWWFQEAVSLYAGWEWWYRNRYKQYSLDLISVIFTWWWFLTLIYSVLVRLAVKWYAKRRDGRAAEPLEGGSYMSEYSSYAPSNHTAASLQPPKPGDRAPYDAPYPIVMEMAPVGPAPSNNTPFSPITYPVIPQPQYPEYGNLHHRPVGDRA